MGGEMKILLTAVLLSAVLGACKKKQPEQIPQPKAAEPVAVSTAVVPSNPLEVPGAYLKATVGQIDKAKAAAALYEKSAAESQKSLELDRTGGN